MNSLWMYAWRARADGTATDEQKDMVKAQADGLEDGKKTLADARAAVDAGTATEEQRDLVKGMVQLAPKPARKEVDIGIGRMESRSYVAIIGCLYRPPLTYRQAGPTRIRTKSDV